MPRGKARKASGGMTVPAPLKKGKQVKRKAGTSNKVKADESFVVQDILDKKLMAGKTIYLIKWVGYGLADSTWEPKENLLPGCILLINKFEKAFSQESAVEVETNEQVEKQDRKSKSQVEPDSKHAQSVNQPGPSKATSSGAEQQLAVVKKVQSTNGPETNLAGKEPRTAKIPKITGKLPSAAAVCDDTGTGQGNPSQATTSTSPMPSCSYSQERDQSGISEMADSEDEAVSMNSLIESNRLFRQLPEGRKVHRLKCVCKLQNSLLYEVELIDNAGVVTGISPELYLIGEVMATAYPQMLIDYYESRIEFIRDDD